MEIVNKLQKEVHLVKIIDPIFKIIIELKKKRLESWWYPFKVNELTGVELEIKENCCFNPRCREINRRK